jgi:hypothetical protein
MATTSRDPRTIVTPDTFSVYPPLLGTPLTGPSRRGVALLIDVALVAVITVLTSGLWFIFGAVAGTVVIRDGVPKVPGNWDRQVTDSTTQPSRARPA